MRSRSGISISTSSPTDAPSGSTTSWSSISPPAELIEEQILHPAHASV